MSDENAMRSGWNARAEKDAFYFVEVNWDGDTEAFFELGEQRARSIIDPVLAEIKASSREVALELGCGVGRFARALGQRFSRVIAADVSDQMIARAKQLHEDPRYSNLDFVSTDGVSLPAESDSIDFVFSYEVFQHMPSREVIRRNIKEVCRVLKPDGTGLLHFRRDENLLLRPAIGRQVYDALRKAKHTVRRAGPLDTDKTFRGIGGLATSAIQDDCRAAGLDVQRWFVDTTNASHIFVVAGVSPQKP